VKGKDCHIESEKKFPNYLEKIRQNNKQKIKEGKRINAKLAEAINRKRLNEKREGFQDLLEEL
jgi:hypothetical protein